MSAITVLHGVSLKGTSHVVWRKGQRVRKWVKPWAHNADCDCEVHQTFTCDRCGRRVGWCLGCHDNMPGACDFCWRPTKCANDRGER